jgi:S-adenosylmethionine:tRNA ribosyltransferase-isomerase
LKTNDFYFDLPAELIAQYPLAQRSDSRLLVYDRATKAHIHSHFRDLARYLCVGDLLVFNDSRVIPARLHGHKASGGRVELLVERIVNEYEFWAHIKASKTPRAGTRIHLDHDWEVDVLAKRGDLYECRALGAVETMLEAIGHIPLPLYITREDEDSDLHRYQTVYAKYKGSVAAPTAGLHFDDELLAQLMAKGIGLAYTTLHVGAGTFRPVRCEQIADHEMHSEWFTVSEDLCEAVVATRARGGRVIAVGTTALRALESAAANGVLEPCCRDTSIFIKPG